MRAFASDQVIIIQLRTAHSNGDVERPVVALALALQNTEAGRDDFRLLFGDRVGHIVRRRIGLLFEDGEVALQLVIQDLRESLGRREHGEGKEQQQKRHEALFYLCGAFWPATAV